MNINWKAAALILASLAGLVWWSLSLPYGGVMMAFGITAVITLTVSVYCAVAALDDKD